MILLNNRGGREKWLSEQKNIFGVRNDSNSLYYIGLLNSHSRITVTCVTCFCANSCTKCCLLTEPGSLVGELFAAFISHISVVDCSRQLPVSTPFKVAARPG